MYNEGGNFNFDQIDDVRKLVKVVKVFVLIIPYWICYSQMNGGLFLLQGLRLQTVKFSVSFPPGNTCTFSDLSNHKSCFQNESYAFYNENNGNHGVSVPGSALTMFNTIFILLVLPFTQKFYFWLAAHKIKVYTWKRMLAGMLLAVLSLLVAGGLETARLFDLCNNGPFLQEIDGTVYVASPNLSIWWQIPQYCLVGTSEIFMALTGMEFAYMEAPRNMQGIAMGIFWCAAALGNVIGLAVPDLFYLFGGWDDKNDINCTRLDYVFYILSGSLLIYSVVFAAIVSRNDLSLSKVITDQPSTTALEEFTASYSQESSDYNSTRLSIASDAAIF